MADYRRLLEVTKETEITPVSFLKPSFEAIEESLERGFNIVTPNNPWLNLIEASATMTVANMEHANVLTRRQYRRLAQSEKDLSVHMSDRDHLNRFSKPTDTQIQFVVSYDWLVANAKYDVVGDESYLVIPRDTVWKSPDLDFYQHVDIKLHLLPSGDVQVYAINVDATDIYSPDTVLINHATVYRNGQKLLNISIPVQQLSWVEKTIPVTPNGYRESYVFTDKFYYVQAYSKNGGVWNKIKTTHSDEAYDPDVLTMTLDVIDNTVTCSIPEVYFSKGIVGTELKVIIYTTKGAITRDLSTVAPDDWKWEFKDIFDVSQDFAMSDSSSNLIIVYSESSLRNGSDGMTFDQLKESVVYNGYGKSVSVTHDELTREFNELGYGIYTEKNTIADKVVVATREIPKPASGFISSAPAVTSKDILVDQNRNDVSHIIKNGDVVTIKPGGLFKESNFDVVMVSDTVKSEIDAKSPFDLSELLNQEQYLYTPFHYVLDSTTPIFRADAYYLTKPRRVNTSFVNFNDNLAYVVATSDATVTFDDSRWVITVTASTPAGLTGLWLQLKVTDYQGQVLHMNASQNIVSDTVSTFVFTLESNLSIDSSDRFQTNSLSDSGGTLVDTYIELTREFEFVYLVEETSVTPSSFDSIIEASTIANSVSGVTYDKITFEFGKPISNLNTRSRPVLIPGTPKTYDLDNPKLWSADQYVTNDAGRVYETAEDGTITFAKTAEMGDPIILDGEQQYHWRAGDPVIEDGKMVMDTPSYTARRLRMFLIDAKYLYATTSTVTTYADTIADYVVTFADDVMKHSKDIIERTEMKFEPVSTADTTVVTIAAGRQTSARTAIKFDVSYTMDEARYTDVQLREAIQDSTKVAIAQFIDRQEFSTSDLISELNKISDSYIRNVDVTTSLPGKVVRINANASTFSIKSRIVPTQNQQLTIEDDIAIEITK